MKATKVMAIIGLAWFPFCLLCMEIVDTWEAAAGWGVLAIMYGIALAIVALVQSNKAQKK